MQNHENLSLVQEFILMLSEVDNRLVQEKKPRILNNRVIFSKDLFKHEPNFPHFLFWLKNIYVEDNKVVVGENRDYLKKLLKLITREEGFLQKTSYLNYGINSLQVEIETLYSLVIKRTSFVDELPISIYDEDKDVPETEIVFNKYTDINGSYPTNEEIENN